MPRVPAQKIPPIPGIRYRGDLDVYKRQALIELGYSVPDDIWVCGFDDSQEASYFAPHLTSIHLHGQIKMCIRDSAGRLDNRYGQ